jgi:DNA-binding XRE family transcriptional regulator
MTLKYRAANSGAFGDRIEAYSSAMQLDATDSDAVLSGIGAEVKRRRDRLGLTQIKLAGEAGVHPNVVGRLERGSYNPTVLVLCRIAGALETTLADLARRALKQ